MDPLAPLADLPGVGDAVYGARAAVDRLLAHRVLRRRSAEVSAESSLRGARASAALAGARMSLAELRQQLESGGVVAGPDAALMEGAVRLYADMGTLLGPWEHAPRQVLARMHLLAARGLVEDQEMLGRPGGEIEGPDDLPDLGPRPSPRVVAARLDELSRLLLAPTRSSAIVTAAVVHGELLALRPFPVANGLVARGAARLVLVSRGLDPKSVSVPEVGHLELDDDYARAAHGYVSAEPAGVAHWLVHCARAVELGAREGVAVCEALSRAGEARAASMPAAETRVGAEDG